MKFKKKNNKIWRKIIVKRKPTLSTRLETFLLDFNEDPTATARFLLRTTEEKGDGSKYPCIVA